MFLVMDIKKAKAANALRRSPELRQFSILNLRSVRLGGEELSAKKGVLCGRECSAEEGRASAPMLMMAQQAIGARRWP